MSSTSACRGLYFEEFEIGQKMVSPGRTVTESDVVTFSGISGDFNQIHTDIEYSKSTQFGGRVAHGLLGLSMASGLALRTGVLEGTTIAFREINRWKFTKPVFIGDTIHVEMEVTAKKSFPRQGGGTVTIDMYVKNQNDETVMKGVWVTLVLSKPS
jgi:acyl dehydratase